MLNSAQMIGEAKALVGLARFDRVDVIANFDRLVDAINSECSVTPLGAKRLHVAGMHLLANRLVLAKFLEDHPELADHDAGPAIIVCGMPRTGSTKLQRLLAQDTSLDHMKFWEVIFPLRWPGEKYNERRLAMTTLLERELGEPQLTAAHNLESKEPEEELLLQKCDFTPPNIRDHLDMPIWVEEMTRRSARDRYDVVRQLIVGHKFQEAKEGRAWVFKNAYSGEHLDVIAEIFPQAKLVFTHRDPTAQLGSITSLGWKYRQLYSAPADKVATGTDYQQYWSGFTERTLAAMDRVPDDRLMHVSYLDTLENPMKVVRDIYDFAGLSLDDEGAQAIQDYDARNTQHKHGRHDYSLEEFGLSRASVELAYAGYLERFGDLVRQRTQA